VAKPCAVEIRIFDAAGRLVRTIADKAAPGENSIIWNGRTDDGRRLASGVYFYQIKADGFHGEKKMLLVD
jgi:flagellar hook assembly protein FlgD